MVRYLLRHGKQIELFAKRENSLIGALKRNESEDKVVRAAEKVREAKLQQLKAERNKRFIGEPNKKHTVSESESKDEQWHSMPVEDIIAIYKNRITESDKTANYKSISKCH